MAASERLKKAIESMVRVRAAESVDAEGLRVVWHQGAQGADLLSHATREGKLVRQELSLMEHCFLWTEESFRTGMVKGGSGSSAGLASDEIELDREVDAARVRLAHEALADYAGEDKYLRHIKQKIDYFAAGFAEREQIMVTARGLAARKATAEQLPKARRSPRVLWLALGGLGLGALIASALLLR